MSLADELKKELGVESKLVGGGSGIFDVVIDGKLLFSKYTEGRFPLAGEVVKRVKG